MGALCIACGSASCPAAGKSFADDCPRWQEAEARRDRGEYLKTWPPRFLTGDVPRTGHSAEDYPED